MPVRLGLRENAQQFTPLVIVNAFVGGTVWSLLQLLLATKSFTLTQIGTVAAVYPAVWGLGQLLTDPLADRLCKKDPLFWSMLLQGAVLLAMLFTSSYPAFLALAALLGAGTALVYPTFLTAVAEYTPATQRGHLPLLARCGLCHRRAADGTVSSGIPRPPHDPVYVKSRCFDPFPFPAATEAQQAEIHKLAEQLDSHRKRQQAQHPTLTLTDLYNVVEKLRAGLPLTAKEQVTHENGLAAVVLELHKQLDAAVAAAYDWAPTLPDAELLTRLVQLNQQRAAEEAAGTVRYLRPAYQAKSVSSEQLAMSNEQ
ncbi:MFS transporter [Hymenobacter sp. UYCo722]|uniref:MFS transporter n=1 Tax=Hymenobacter sp. UYCo722 TaxID=3156335 RepID=UPI0033972E84